MKHKRPPAAPPRTALAATLLACAALTPALASAQDLAAGERLFRQRCVACHAVQPGRNIVGPHLAGIVGRTAGSVDGARYSQGMRDLGVTWDAAQLDRYLANPTAMVRGTSMAISVPNTTERANIVEYLKTLVAAP